MNRKNVFITGAAGGIGKALIKIFASNNYNIIAHCRKPDKEKEIYFDEIKKEYGIEIYPVYFDMTDYNAMKTSVLNLFQKKVNIDVLINNAGVAHGGLFAMTPVSKIKEVFEINLFSQMELTRLVLKIMTRKKSGSIVNISSIAGLDLAAGNSAYGVSKAALAAWTKTLAAEFTGSGIRINAVAPGLTDTRMAVKKKKKAKQEMISASAMNRLAKPEEIAQAVFFLTSDAASFINGQILRVDGGAK